MIKNTKYATKKKSSNKIKKKDCYVMIDQEPYKIVRIMKAINYMFEVQKLTYYKISNIF